MSACADKIVIRLPGEPEAKDRPRAGKNHAGKTIMFTTAKTRRIESALGWAARAAMGAREPIEGPLKVVVYAFVGIPASWSKKKQEQARMRLLRPTGKPDADNIAKTVDGLNGIAWKDDAQVVDLFVRKFYSDAPELVITVERSPEEAP